MREGVKKPKAGLPGECDLRLSCKALACSPLTPALITGWTEPGGTGKDEDGQAAGYW